MADKAKAYLDAIGETLKAWPVQKRVTMALSVGLGIAVLTTMLMWSNKQTYAPLMSNLSEEDAGQIVSRLEADHVPFQLASNGTAILVPQTEVYALRLKLASDGLPKGGNVGFELFDSPSFGMSRFAEQLNYRRGLEGELRRSIRQIDAVQDARVHIVVPEQGLFREQDKRATAAITLHMRHGRTLGAGQVQAIVHLVASSVAGLSPEQVTVVDSAGSILAKGGEHASGMGGALEQQRNVEKGIEERVHAILAPIVGAQHVVVRASAVLDFSRTEKTTETFDPASAVIRSEQMSEEKRSGAGSSNGGIPGSRGNLSGIEKSAPAAGGGVNERRSSTHNYEVNKIVAHEVGAAGRLSRLSVAVLVDGIESVDADGKKLLKERTPEELARFEELSRRAMGFDADREDQVSVQSMAFNPVAVEEAAPDNAMPAWVGMAERFWPPLVALLAVGILGSIMWRARPLPSSATSRESLGTGVPRTVRELEAAIGQAAAQGNNSYHLGVPPPDVMAKLTTRLEPKLAASVLKGWLNEA